MSKKKITEVRTSNEETITREQLVKNVVKSSGASTEDVDMLIKHIEKDKEPDIDSIEDAKAKKALKAAYKALQAAIAKSDEIEDEIAAAAEAEEKKAAAEEKKRGKMLAVSSAKGHALSQAFADSTVAGLQKLAGKKFVVSATGVRPADGSTINENDVATLIATLAEVSERETAVRSTIMLGVGSSVLMARELFGEEMADELVQQVVSNHGQSKHTVLDSERVVKYINELFPDGDAPANLSYTHYQELKNGTREKDGTPLLTPAKIKAIVKKVATGKVTATLKGEDGKDIEQRKPLSCAELRELLNEAKGLKSGGDEDGDEDGDEAGEKKAKSGKLGYVFLYIDVNDVNKVYTSKELDKERLSDSDNWHVLNIAEGGVVSAKGKTVHKFKELSSLDEDPDNVAYDASAEDDDELPE